MHDTGPERWCVVGESTQGGAAAALAWFVPLQWAVCCLEQGQLKVVPHRICYMLRVKARHRVVFSLLTHTRVSGADSMCMCQLVVLLPAAAVSCALCPCHLPGPGWQLH